MFRNVRIGTERPEDQVELARKGMDDGIDAARAGSLETATVISPEANVGDDITRPAMFFKKIGPASRVQVTYLLKVIAELDCARSQGLVELQWLLL